MSLPSTAIIEIRSTATANNVNGGGFNSARGGADYSQQDAAQINNVDGTSTASTTFTSALATFTSAMVGNYLHITAGTGATVGWYEIVTYVDANTITLDRVSGTYTAATFYVGGAMSLGSALDDDLFEIAVTGNIFYIKAGSYTLGENVAPSVSGGVQNPIIVEGYNTTRGDKPTGSNRPNINGGTYTITTGTNWNWSNIILTSTSTVFNASASAVVLTNCKATNISTTAARVAFGVGAGDCFLFNCEGISYRGIAVSGANAAFSIYGCYLHSSDTGYLTSATTAVKTLLFNIIESCITAAISSSAASVGRLIIANNTICGTPNKRGTGVSLATGNADNSLLNNIIYGFTTGVSHANSTQTIGQDDYNCYNNNTTDVTNWAKGGNDITTAPSFTSFVERSGSTATTTAGNHLVQTGATFVTWGVTAGVDYVYISGGTGVTAGFYGILSVDSETQITVDIALTADATADKVWSITTGHNFLPTVTLAGFPGSFPGGLTTGYLGIGAVQREVVAGGGRPEIRGSNL